jgi:hypothetical protein
MRMRFVKKCNQITGVVITDDTSKASIELPLEKVEALLRLIRKDVPEFCRPKKPETAKA